MDKSELTYSKYLCVDELISLQRPLANPSAHDEMLFIIVHQSYELWFKQILFDLNAVMRALHDDKPITVFKLMHRVCEVIKLLIHQIEILETMTPVEFNRFRSHLNPASGFQSLQFRELEMISGIDLQEYEKFFKLEPEWEKKVKNGRKGNLRESFFEFLKRRNFLKEKKSLEENLLSIYEDENQEEVKNLCEYFIQYDEIFSLWRFRHVQMVERMIGMKRGTGGSLGVSYLQNTLKKRFFPELWATRTAMNGSY